MGPFVTQDELFMMRETGNNMSVLLEKYRTAMSYNLKTLRIPSAPPSLHEGTMSINVTLVEGHLES